MTTTTRITARTTMTARRRRPCAVLAAITGLIAVLAVTSWTTDPPSTQQAYRLSATSVLNAPAWGRLAAEIAAEAGILALAALAGVLTWRARRAGAAALSRALLAGGGTVLAYATSEVLKLVLTQVRPCTSLGLTVLAECPGFGDWSLPSNHATVAAALAAAAFLAAPRWGVPALLTALVVAAARVGTGVHYPHDVMTGLVLGAAVVALTALFLDRPAHSLLRAAARHWSAIVHRP